MEGNQLRISYQYDDVWACKLTLKDTMAYLESLQQFFINKIKADPAWLKEERAWLLCSIQVHIHCLDEELREMKANGKIEITDPT